MQSSFAAGNSVSPRLSPAAVMLLAGSVADRVRVLYTHITNILANITNRCCSRLTLLSRIFHHQERDQDCQPYHDTIFCHRSPPPDNSTNYVLSLPTSNTLQHYQVYTPATLHYQVYQICFFSVSDAKTYIYAVNNIDIMILHIIACCLL